MTAFTGPAEVGYEAVGYERDTDGDPETKPTDVDAITPCSMAAPDREGAGHAGADRGRGSLMSERCARGWWRSAAGSRVMASPTHVAMESTGANLLCARGGPSSGSPDAPCLPEVLHDRRGRIDVDQIFVEQPVEGDAGRVRERMPDRPNRRRSSRNRASAGNFRRFIPLDRRPVLAENPVTRWLPALCAGQRAKAEGGERTNRGS